MLFSRYLALAGAFAGALAAPFGDAFESAPIEERDGVKYRVFRDEKLGTEMRFVTNSTICETTPGVTQYSGYFSVGSNMNMFFWFFEARNNPSTAPFSTWFNGGPGCSSMIGLFQENGPCQFYNGASTPSLNPYSYNNYANMLYVDQPIGVGFSYGNDPVDSTVAAAPYVWNLLQAFFKQFPKYQSRDFGIMTESYGGHYGPEFADYIQSQNAAIASGKLSAQKINLVALGINNGYFDELIQQYAYIDYAYSNKYKQILSASRRNTYINYYNNYCAPYAKRCTSYNDPSQNNACANAENYCYRYVEGAITQEADFDVYDVRQPAQDPYPPNAYLDYLNRADVQQAIGAKSTNFQYCSNAAGNKFGPTGDEARSFLPVLSRVVQSGIQVLIFAGDADYICNYLGNFRVVNNVTWAQQSTFANKALTSYNVNGKATGLFKTVSNLSWLQVYAAGHEVPYYQPATSLQAFKQTMMKQGLSST